MLATVRRTVIAAAVTVASLGAITAPASAAGVHQQIDPVYTSTPCKHDTSPNYPSCGTTKVVVAQKMVAIKVPDPWFTIAPCPHDESLPPDLCYSHPR